MVKEVRGGAVIDTQESETLMLKNSQLGEFSLHKDMIFEFRRGIFGYEFLQQFAIVDIKESEPFLWCVAVDEPEITLPVLKYKYIYPDYQLNLSSIDREDLELEPNDPFHIFFIITVDEKLGTVTANLKGPLILNLEKRLGSQIIMPNEEYVVNYPIIQNGTENV